jgi:hypothetical protein
MKATSSDVPVRAIQAYLGFCSLLVVLQIVLTYALSAGGIKIVNFLVPLSLLAVNLLLGWHMVSRSPMALWNPFVWFLLASSLYYGLGQTVHLFGNPDTIERVNSLYVVDAVGLARTNLLHTVGILSIVGTYLITGAIRRLALHPSGRETSVPSTSRDALRQARATVALFLCVGIPVKYFLELPYNLGLLKWVLPGSIQYFGTLSGLALIPLYWLYKKRGGVYRPAFFALLLSEILVDLVSLSKLEMIKTALFLLLGSQLIKPGLKKLVISSVLIVLSYVFIFSPFVTFARVAAGRAAAKDVSQAMDLVDQFYKKGAAVQDGQFPKAQLWWARLAYSNVELFAMRQYDRGQPGATFKLAPYTLVPRFLYPEKPMMNSGLMFTELITDGSGLMSHTGLGALGEGYWNGGWLGVVGVGMVIGLLFSIIGAFSLRVLESRQFIFLPIVFGGILMGLRIDDWFVPTYIGLPIQLLLVFVGICAVVRPALLGSIKQGGQAAYIPAASSPRQARPSTTV